MTKNAAHLFQNPSLWWPPSSESFWTAIFSQFVLHLGSKPVAENSLTDWRCRVSNTPPYYERRLNDSDIRFNNFVL